MFSNCSCSLHATTMKHVNMINNTSLHLPMSAAADHSRAFWFSMRLLQRFGLRHPRQTHDNRYAHDIIVRNLRRREEIRNGHTGNRQPHAVAEFPQCRFFFAPRLSDSLFIIAHFLPFVKPFPKLFSGFFFLTPCAFLRLFSGDSLIIPYLGTFVKRFSQVFCF